MDSFLATKLCSPTWLVVFLLFLFAAVPAGAPQAAEQTVPFKIGVLAPLAGPQTQLGQNLATGVRRYFRRKIIRNTPYPLFFLNLGHATYENDMPVLFHHSANLRTLRT